jgi:hypothetical protein
MAAVISPGGLPISLSDIWWAISFAWRVGFRIHN